MPLSSLFFGPHEDVVELEIAVDECLGAPSVCKVTQQTTEGTKRTAVSIGQLAELAKELKGSVSGFKIA